MRDKQYLANRWQVLQRFTDARIAQGRTGVSLPTHQLLQFQLDHANAQDAVHLGLDMDALLGQLKTISNTYVLHSCAHNRDTYLKNPGLGRRLNEESLQQLGALRQDKPVDVAIVIADGLSCAAIQRNAPGMVSLLVSAFSRQGISTSPLFLVNQGRVAVGDEVAQALNAKAVVLLVGERPGLSSPDSLGIYFTLHPHVGISDAKRNCISNIRTGGLSYQEALDKLMWLYQGALTLGESGVNLKDDTAPAIASEASFDSAVKLFPTGK